MKSKTSCFNLTIFRKNIVLYWPIWTGYLLLCLFVVPGALWIRFRTYVNNIKMYGDCYTSDYRLNVMVNSLNLSMWAMLIFLMSILTGMAIYNYLFQARSNQMMHAFPVTRTELFVTNYVSGLLFLLIPELIAFVSSIFVCIFFEITTLEYLGIWLLAVLAMSILFYSVTTFCAMLTGHLFALPFYTIVANLVVLGICAVVRYAVIAFGYGVESMKTVLDMKLMWLSPLYHLVDKVRFVPKYTWTKDRIPITAYYEFEGTGILISYLFLAMLLFVFSLYIYKKRNLENVGDILTHQVMKPVFRWGCGFCGGLTLAVALYQLLHSLQIFVGTGVAILFLLVFGTVCFCLAQMLTVKNFRIFGKKFVVELGTFLMVFLLSFGVIRVVAGKTEKYVPSVDQIEQVTVRLSNNLTFSKVNTANIEQVVAFHEHIVDRIEKIRTENTENCFYYYLEYTLTNQKQVIRDYCIPLNDEGKEIVKEIITFEERPEIYIQSLFGESEPDFTKMKFDSATLDFLNYEENGELTYDRGYSYVNMSQENARTLAEAVCADIKDGKVQKYNFSHWWEREDGATETAYACSINFDWIDEASIERREPNSMIYGYSYAYVRFGPDCENIIHALLELEAISSVDDLKMEVIYEK